jgi:flagellar biosynthesis component FlhA
LLGEWLNAGLPAEVADHLRTIRDDHRLLRRTSRQLQELLTDRVPLTQAERVATGLTASHRVEDPAEGRRILRDSLRDQLWGNDGEYLHFKLSDSINALLNGKSSPRERLELSPEDLQEFLSAVRSELGSNGHRAAIVTSGERLRYLVRYLIREEWNEVPVLAEYELVGPIPYDKLPVISLE